MVVMREMVLMYFCEIRNKTDPIDPIDPIDPTDPTDPIDPIDPTDPTDPTDPIDPISTSSLFLKVHAYLAFFYLILQVQSKQFVHYQ